MSKGVCDNLCETIEEGFGEPFASSSLRDGILASEDSERGRAFENPSQLWDEDLPAMIETGVQTLRCNPTVSLRNSETTTPKENAGLSSDNKPQFSHNTEILLRGSEIEHIDLTSSTDCDAKLSSSKRTQCPDFKAWQNGRTSWIKIKGIPEFWSPVVAAGMLWKVILNIISRRSLAAF